MDHVGPVVVRKGTVVSRFEVRGRSIRHSALDGSCMRETDACKAPGLKLRSPTTSHVHVVNSMAHCSTVVAKLPTNHLCKCGHTSQFRPPPPRLNLRVNSSLHTRRFPTEWSGKVGSFGPRETQ